MGDSVPRGGEPGCTSTTRPLEIHSFRPLEIIEWLAAHADSAEPRRWIAIDDRLLLKEHEGEKMEGHFLRTSYPEGLGESQANEAIALLNGQQ